MKIREWGFRIFFYVTALLILALGITLNTKTMLGVSPIVSVSYAVSQVFRLNFGNTTMGLYVLFVMLELVFRGKNRRYYDLLQIGVSLVFTRFLNVFDKLFDLAPQTLPGRIVLLLIAVVLTGVGAALSVNMHLIPNPGDGVVSALADFIGKDMGFAKNLFDTCCIIVTFIIGLVSGHFLLGIGLGTVIAVIGVGRVVAAFNYLCKKPMAKLAGLQKAGTESK